MAQIEKRDIVIVNVNLPSDMVKQVKEYANELGLPITQAYVVLIHSALQHKDMIKQMPMLLESISVLKDLALKNNLEEDI